MTKRNLIIKLDNNKQIGSIFNKYGSEYFETMGGNSIGYTLDKIDSLIGNIAFDADELKKIRVAVQELENKPFDSKSIRIIVFVNDYLNTLERQHLIDRINKATGSYLKAKLLADVEHFLKKMECMSEVLQKSANNNTSFFVDRYVDMVTTKDYSDSCINVLYLLIPNMLRKSSDGKLDKLIEIDSYAHLLHNSIVDDDSKQELNALASKAKACGEENREDRLVVLYDAKNKDKLRNMLGINILLKMNVLESRLKRRAEKIGIENLSSDELALLWGYVSGELN